MQCKFYHIVIYTHDSTDSYYRYNYHLSFVLSRTKCYVFRFVLPGGNISGINIVTTTTLNSIHSTKYSLIEMYGILIKLIVLFEIFIAKM